MWFYLKQLYCRLQWKNPLYEIFLKWKTALDLWCWEWDLIRYSKWKILWVDLNKYEVDKLQKEWYKVTCESVTKTSFKNQSFDVVISDNVIEHLAPQDAYDMFLEMHRLLKKWGIVLLKTPLPKIIWNTFWHIKPYTPQSIKKLFRANSREAFDPISWFSVIWVYYYSLYSKYKAIFMLNYLLWIFIPFFRISYLIIIKKHEK